KSIELLSLLIKQKNEFEISDKCIITPTNADAKKLILQLKKLTDISHVWFYISSTYLLTHYAGRLLIKLPLQTTSIINKTDLSIILFHINIG
ncbi:TPA: hypothetical protein ACHKTP_005122, partial [Escherichia coli]